MKLLPALAACVVGAWSCIAPFNIHAHAASDIVQLTPGQTRALFGDTISGSYYDDSSGDYVACSFSYLGSTALAGRSPMRQADTFDRVSPVGSSYLIYQSDFQGLAPVRPYYSVRLNPVVSLGMLKKFSMVVGFSQAAVQVHQDPEDPDSPLVWDTVVENCAENRGGYPENYWSALMNGNRVGANSCDAWTTGSNILDWLHWAIGWTAQTNRRFFVPNIIDLSSDSFFSVSDIQVTRQGNAKATDSASARTLLYISCPVLTSDYEDNNNGGNTGTDLTATNAKLDTIISILSLIASQNSGSGTDQDTEPNDTDSSVESDADEFDDQIDQINDQFDYIEEADSVVDDVEFERARYTDIYDPVKDLIVQDPADHQIVPDQGGVPGSLPNSMAVIDQQIDGVANPFSLMMVVAAMIALISFVIFGKWG